ncbi:Inner membrane ABC transporter permease protein YnjC [Betaproteobacteria bacterium MOLA814]|nr:Inner membrane ABC transporter permease protein YnjC [Betaproteobacteria bacterium MOLA814]
MTVSSNTFSRIGLFFMLSALALALGIPLAAALGHAGVQGASHHAWDTLLRHPSTGTALLLSLITSLVSVAACVGLAKWLVFYLWVASGQTDRSWQRFTRWLPAMLAMPHVAFAIGIVWLIAPSGWLVRVVSPGLTGWQWPPDWPLVNDAFGLGLCAVLIGKELPFLLWSLATQLQRPDMQQTLSRAMTTATCLGYSPRQTWRRIMWPMLLPKLGWPLMAMFAYGISQVDMALVVGPNQPPTLAVLAWQWLQDPDPRMASAGIAAAWLLSVAGAACAFLTWLAMRWQGWQRLNTRGHHNFSNRVPTGSGHTTHQHKSAVAFWRGFSGVYVAIVLALATASLTLYWPFPNVWPQQWHWGAWAQALISSEALGTTCSLASMSSIAAMLWTLAWLEAAPPRLELAIRPALYGLLVLPPVLWLSGLHQAATVVGIDASWVGVGAAHTLAVLPYTVLMLSPAYLSFDQRLSWVSASLGVPTWRYLLGVKWPMLKTAILNAWAVGFAVSVAQYLPTQMLGAGRVTTITTEAVTLASGGQRDTASAFGLLQIVLPAVAFGLAHVWAKRTPYTY